jgi:hypothetical protein
VHFRKAVFVTKNVSPILQRGSRKVRIGWSPTHANLFFIPHSTRAGAPSRPSLDLCGDFDLCGAGALARIAPAAGRITTSFVSGRALRQAQGRLFRRAKTAHSTDVIPNRAKGPVRNLLFCHPRLASAPAGCPIQALFWLGWRFSPWRTQRIQKAPKRNEQSPIAPQPRPPA